MKATVQQNPLLVGETSVGDVTDTNPELKTIMKATMKQNVVRFTKTKVEVND
jgi:hypothetical protein